ncbi:MAG: CidA/LrgA family protein [Clostridia bacterium]
MLGEFLNYLLPFPVPSGVYGLFILLLCFAQVHYIQKMWRKWENSSWIRCRLCSHCDG